MAGRRLSQRILEELGKPTVIVTCPGKLENIKKNFPEIPVKTIYDILIEWEISGGCYEEDCCVYEDDTTVDGQIKILAEDVGARIHGNSGEAENCSFLTSRISVRDKLRSEGEKPFIFLKSSTDSAPRTRS